MNEPRLVDSSALFATLDDFVRVRYAPGVEGLARVIGWADAAGRSSTRAGAIYVVVIGDVSAGPGWDRPTLLRLPEGSAV